MVHGATRGFAVVASSSSSSSLGIAAVPSPSSSSTSSSWSSSSSVFVVLVVVAATFGTTNGRLRSIAAYVRNYERPFTMGRPRGSVDSLLKSIAARQNYDGLFGLGVESVNSRVICGLAAHYTTCGPRTISRCAVLHVLLIQEHARNRTEKGRA